MSLREWLIAIGTLVILGIVIDGVRRMRRARKESMAISSGMGADELQESPLDEDFNPELPNGGARTISRETLEERGYVKKAGKSRFANPEPKPTRPVVAGTEGEARKDQGGDDVRPDSESERVDSDQRSSRPDIHEEAPVSQEPESQIDPDYQPEAEPEAEPEFEAESGWSALDDEPQIDDGNEEILGAARTVRPEQVAAKSQVPEGEEGLETLAPDQTTDVEQDTARRTPSEPVTDQPLAGANRPEAQEVIVINVLAKQGKDFQGPALKQLFEACGLAHGDMDIYHRHEQSDTYSPVQFSVANAVEPGTFRPQDMEGMATPGISFFMSMPGPSNALQAFDFMLETAQCVVRNLGGELKDERRSVMTGQTIEHCRQRIREYERKRRSQPRG